MDKQGVLATGRDQRVCNNNVEGQKMKNRTVDLGPIYTRA